MCLHKTIVSVVDNYSLLSFVLVLCNKEGQGVLMTTTTTTSLTCPSIIQGVVGSA